jgi:hypothetical protein
MKIQSLILLFLHLAVLIMLANAGTNTDDQTTTKNCEDKPYGTRPSECPDRQAYCDFEPYKEFMLTECPATCDPDCQVN